MNKLKELLNLGKTTESPSGLSKSPRKDFNSVGEKRVSVYAYNNLLIFIGGAEFSDGGDTSWSPYFALSKQASPREKGEAILKTLEGYTVGIDYDTNNTGELEEKETLKLTRLKDIKTFYRKAKRCGILQYKDTRKIEIMPFKKERGYGNYSALCRTGMIEKIPDDDIEALGQALDECIEKCKNQRGHPLASRSQ